MKVSLSKKLYKKYPWLRGNIPEGYKGPVMPIMFGLEIGDGWYGILDRLCASLQEFLDKGETISVEQVKEKYGTLRFYASVSNEKMFALIDKADEESAITCEVCGKKGKLRTDRAWFLTLCNKHSKMK